MGAMRAAHLAALLGVAAAQSTDKNSPSFTNFAYDAPENWYIDHPECHNNLQSPLNLETAASESTGRTFLKMWIPRKPVDARMSMSSNGPTLVVDMLSRDITLTGQGFWSQYTLHEMRYHTPSEHTLDGERYPLERQLVFYPSDVAQLQEQGQSRYPIVIISELYKVDESHPDPMLQALQAAGLGGTSVGGEGQGTMGTGNNVVTTLNNFRPAFGTFMQDEFYVYPGSLTWPPCWEVVTWHVSSKVHTVTTPQLEMIHSLIDSLTGAHQNGNPFPKEDQMMDKKGNSRPLQERNNRTIKKVSFYSID